MQTLAHCADGMAFDTRYVTIELRGRRKGCADDAGELEADQ